MAGQRRTPAQWYGYLVGAALLLAGVLGFLADATFDTAGAQAGDSAAPSGNANGQLQGDGFLGFEVNGWHNVVHLISGIVLLALASRRGRARLGAIAFGVIYAVVAIIGLLDGNDVLGIIPVNPADNVLHVALSALGLLAGLAPRHDDRDAGPQERSTVAAAGIGVDRMG